MNESASSIFTRLFRNSFNLGDKIAVIGDESRLSFQELHSLSAQLSSDLAALEFIEGAVVGLRFRDPLKHLITSLALLKEGITQVTIAPWENLAAQRKIADFTGVTAIISDTMGPVIRGIVNLTFTPDWHLQGECAIQTAPAAQASYPALLVVGSGTTGRPKLIAVGFYLLAELIKRDINIRNHKSGERHYCESSFDYYTSKRRTLGYLAAGATVMLPQAPPPRLVTYCLENDIQHLSLTTSQATKMLAQEHAFHTPCFPRLPDLRTLFVSSSPVSEGVRHRIRREISDQLFVVYGSNEFGEATIASPADQDKHSGTVGKPCPGVLIDVIDNSGNLCSPGEKGNIRFKSTPMMQGYHMEYPDSSQHFKEDGFYPGDLGFLTEDGNLIFSGRSDDMMIYRGVNIYPREIEVVLESHPAVSDAAAFPLLTSTQENLPFAVVCATDVSERELLAHCQKHLGWRRPIRIFFMQVLPRNAAGKVLKRVLAEKVASRIMAEKKSNLSSP